MNLVHCTDVSRNKNILTEDTTNDLRHILVNAQHSALKNVFIVTQKYIDLQHEYKAARKLSDMVVSSPKSNTERLCKYCSSNY